MTMITPPFKPDQGLLATAWPKLQTVSRAGRSEPGWALLTRCRRECFKCLPYRPFFLTGQTKHSWFHPRHSACFPERVLARGDDRDRWIDSPEQAGKKRKRHGVHDRRLPAPVRPLEPPL